MPTMLRKSWRILRTVVLVVIAVVALLVGGTWTFLQTRWGGEAVRRLALPRLNAQIAGHLALARVAFGGDRVTLEGVELREPGGATVAALDRVEVVFSPLALLRREVDLRALMVTRPRLWLVTERDGTNLSRALASRPPATPASPPAPPPTRAPGGGDWTIALHRLSILDGAFAYGGPSGPRQVHVDDLAARGRLRVARQLLEVDLATEARGAHVRATGAIDLATMQVREPGFSIRGQGIVLADLFAAGPPSRFDFELQARGGGTTLAGLDGTLKLLVPPGRLDGHAFGPVRLDLRAARGRYTLDDLGAVLPGLTITGNGTATATRIDAHLRVDARDLTATVRSLAPRGGPPPVALAGQGRLDVALTGAPGAPALRIAGQFPTLQIDANRLEGLTLSATIPDVTRPTRVTAQVAAPRGALDGQKLRALTLKLDAAGRDLAAEAHVSAPYPLALTARGRRGAGDGDLTLHALSLRYPDGSWTLARPARVDVGGGKLVVRDFALAADRQTIALDLTRTAHKLDGHVVVGHLDLGRLPRALVPAALGLAGELDLDARIDDQARRPRLALELALRGLTIKKQLVGDVHLAVQGDGSHPSNARLELTPIAAAGGGKLSLGLKTPLSLRTMMRRPPTAETLLRTPFELRGDVDRLPLQTLALLARRKDRVAGTVSAHVEVSGSAAAPTGTLAVDVDGAAAGSFPPTNARVEVDLARHAIDARVRIVRKQHPLLALTAHVDGELAELRSPERAAAAPLKVRAVVGPLLTQRLGLPASDRQPPRVLKGKLHADLALDGSLRAPRLVAHVRASDLSLDKSLVGAAEVAITYAAHKLGADARLTSANGGALHLTAATTADLGYPAVTRPLDLRRLPIELQLDARDFDLKGLSGMIPELRTVAGRLSADATARGTLADPRLRGRLEWKDGMLAVTGFGEYKEIHLALHGDEQKLVLDELQTRSGHGKARLTGEASHTQGHYRVAASADVTRFPIYQEGQPLAEVTVAAKVTGDAAPFDSTLRVDLDKARVELPSAKRRDLQSLASPEDIVLVDGGAPLNKAQAEKLRKLSLGRDGDRTAPAATKEAPARPATRVRIIVDAPRQIWVTGKDANLELGLAPNFRVVMGTTTRIIGTVEIHRGRVDVFGRRFDLKSDSTVKFDGAPDYPDLDVRAVHRNQTENVSVLVTAKGTPGHLKITVTSPDRPELTESELYMLIITGRLKIGGATAASSPAGQAASLLGGVLAGQLQRTLAHRLPLDVLTIDAGSEGLTGTQLEAGRYLTDRFYVGYIGRVGANPSRYQNRNAVHLEYQLTARWEIEGEYGDVGTGSADLMWKKNY